MAADDLFYLNTFSLILFAGVSAAIAQSLGGTDAHTLQWSKGLAGVCFVAYIAAAFSVLVPDVWEDGAALLIRGLLITIGVYNLLRIILPLPVKILGGGIRKLRQTREARTFEAEERRRARERQRQQDESQRKWEQDAPLRERQYKEAEARRKAEQEAQQRRDRARAQCELLYALHAPEIGDRFSRQDMERFFSMYMTEKHSVDEVERRAGELQRIITEHRQAVKPIQQQKSIEEIVVWYKSAKATIDNMDVESNYKSYFKSQLEEKFAELSEDALRKVNL